MAEKTGFIDLNTATADEIAKADIEQISEDRANELVEYRSEHGPFESWEEVKQVPGFSNEMVKHLREAGTKISDSGEEGATHDLSDG